MLKANAIGNAAYYLELAREEYYFEGGSPEGFWLGKSASLLGLDGKVAPDALRSLIDGFSPDGEKLVRNAGAEDRQAGWDLSFSVPKSVSSLWSQADKEARLEIEAALRAAAEEVVDYLEQTATFSRRGHAGAEVERSGLAVAAFPHFTSRADDPQLHVHLVVVNATIREDGSPGSLLSRPFYFEQHAAGAVGRAALATELQERFPGLELERDGDFFRAKAVPRSLDDAFSTRRQEVLDLMRETGIDDDRAALFSRTPKTHTPLVELQPVWREVGAQEGFTELEVRAALVQGEELEPHSERFDSALSAALQAVFDQASTFSERDFRRAFAVESQGRALSLEDLFSARDSLFSNDRVEHIGDQKGQPVFASTELIATEQKMLFQVEWAKEERGFIVDRDALEHARATTSFSLSAEQDAALEHLTRAPGQFQTVPGLAGTGKTTVLEAARDAWNESGFDVIGCAFQNTAARKLEDASGIPSSTVHRLLRRIEEGREHLSDATVVVLDEAATLSTPLCAPLVDAVSRAGAKLVLLGDDAQTPAIGPGGAFTAINDRVGVVSLTEILRQHEPWEREAVTALHDGEIREALLAYGQNGRFNKFDTREEVHAFAVGDWARAVKDRPESGILIAPTRAEAYELNRLAQEERFESLGESGARVGEEFIYEGDFVRFTKNLYGQDVDNGDRGTVVSVNREQGQLFVELPDGRSATVHDYDESIRLAYADTVHSTQGGTYEHVFVALGGAMQDQELTYTAASRAQAGAHFYIDDAAAGLFLRDIIASMSQSHRASLAMEHAHRARSEFTGPDLDTLDPNDHGLGY